MDVPEVALVTGANRGLGKEVARQLGHRGFSVLIGSRDLDRGDRAAGDLRAEGVDAVSVLLDVTDPKGVQAVADRILEQCGRLDVLVNNAGVFVGIENTSTTVAEMRTTFEVNVFGVVTMINAMLPLLARSPGPRIVNVSSTTASLGLTTSGADLPGDAGRRLAYASAKAALNMLTVQYAAAFAKDPSLAHVTVNSTSPGYTATDMNDRRGTRSVQVGARVIVDFAVSRPDVPTGSFYDDAGPIPW